MIADIMLLVEKISKLLCITDASYHQLLPIHLVQIASRQHVC